MKLALSYTELHTQRKKMGAQISSWVIDTTELNPREKFLADLNRGIEIELGDVEPGPGGLLTYKGEQVLLYIKDTRSSLWTLSNEPEKSRRFHVAECQTLDTMRNEGRFERYVVTNRMDGMFLVDWLDPETRERGETEAGLKVCKNCLKALDWRGYEQTAHRMQVVSEGRTQRKGEIWRNFSINEFLMEYSTFFRTKPDRRDTDAKLNEYVADWPRISERKRHEARWCCEQCGVDLSGHPGLLHCHHKNGVVTDNSPSNLSVLCALDHARQPGHQWMKVAPGCRQIIQAARVQQGIRS
ncbi:MAG: HNH endonuclease [Alphaproteobacteria bacterium]